MDPVLVDGYGNEDRCRQEIVDKQNVDLTRCQVEASPTLICLDGAGTSDGPDYTGPTGRTLVTVGVGAGTGDSWVDEEGAGGSGDWDGHPGEGGHGGI